MHTNLTKSVVLDIIETYESFLRRDWNNTAAKERWCYWKAILAGLG